VLDALFNFSSTALNLARRVVVLPVVDCFELAAINGHNRLRKELQVTKQHYAAAYVADAVAVITAEVGNGREVRCQATSQLHQLDVALRLAHQASTRLDWTRST
jgi:hypothetical protein